jgi:hypothetical protein
MTNERLLMVWLEGVIAIRDGYFTNFAQRIISKWLVVERSQKTAEI